MMFIIPESPQPRRYNKPLIAEIRGVPIERYVAHLDKKAELCKRAIRLFSSAWHNSGHQGMLDSVRLYQAKLDEVQKEIRANQNIYCIVKYGYGLN